MMTSNEQILDQIIRRAVALERYKNGVVRRVLKVLNKSTFPELQFELTNDLDRIRSVRRKKILIQKADKIYAAAIREAKKTLDQELTAFAKQEARWTASMISNAIPASLNISLALPAAAQIRSAWSGTAFEGFLLREYWTQVDLRQRRFFRQQLTIGFAEGESTQQIVRRIRGGFDGTQRQVTAVVRTAVTHVSSQARSELYKSNADIVKSEQWLSTLDSRTTLICMGLDGKIFEIGVGIRPPAHIGCRSTVIPVLFSFEELGFKGVDLPESTRASMNGQVPARLSYPQWLRTLSKDDQNKILGPSRAKLWRGNKVTIDKFVNSQRQTLTLDKLDSF